jgi:hypothetical protein
MRGEERQQRSMLMVLNLEQRVLPKDHPLRRIKQLAETVPGAVRKFRPDVQRDRQAVAVPIRRAFGARLGSLGRVGVWSSRLLFSKSGSDAPESVRKARF